jgi:hypothetical protein
MFGYMIGVIFLTVIAILSVMIRRRESKHLPTSDRLGVWWSRIRGQFVPGTIACLVFFGSLFHVSVKEEYIATWDQQKSMLKQLRSLAPALQDDSFVVVVRDQNDPGSPVHYDLSSFLMALYGNGSIMGNTDWQLKFHSDGVESYYYREKVRSVNSRISYDRLLLFESDGGNLRMLPKIEVKTEEGKPLIVLNNPHRILSGPAVRTAVWRTGADESNRNNIIMKR